MFRCSVFRNTPLINDETDFDDIKFIVIYDERFSLADIEKISKGFAFATNTYRDDIAEYKTAYDHKPQYKITIKCDNVWVVEYNDKEFKNL